MTFPKGVRDRLGLSPGTELAFEAAGGVLVARKVERQDVFAKWRGRGRLPIETDVDGYLKASRLADGD